MPNNALSIYTPKGYMTVQQVRDELYPGIEIKIKGKLVVLVEYNVQDQKFNIHTYVNNKEEPDSLEYIPDGN